MTRALALVLLLAPGCAWVTGKEEADKTDRDGDGLDWQDDCDDDDASIGEEPTWYEDGDGDGHGDPESATTSCGQPPGAVAAGDDCDDDRADVYPGADETWYDGVDQDCGDDLDGDADADGDGYDSEVAGGEDCDDANASAYPGAPEGAYDGVDQDCDGADADDLDDDGYTGEAAGGRDCDDNDADVNPGAEEVWYDGRDGDCDGADDDDADGDGHAGEPAGGPDCDDADGEVNPDAEEVCGDGVDNDCDGDASCDIEGEASLSASDAVFTGLTKSDTAGSSVALIADWDADGDGTGDGGAAAVGAPGLDGSSGNEGAVAIFASAPSGTLALTDADVVLYGETSGDAAGTAISVGDCDEDGHLDLLIGAPTADAGGTSSGVAYVVPGPVAAGTVSLGSAGYVLAGDDPGDQAGTTVVFTDLSGDGVADAVVASPYQEGSKTDQGAVYIVNGPLISDFLLGYADGEWTGDQTSDWVGSSLGAAGDVDGDGLNDLIFGSYKHDGFGSERGAAWLVLGPGDDETSVADADATLLGEDDSNYAGHAVDGVGDSNGDGYGDVLVGAPYYGGGLEGAAYVVLGPVRGAFDLYNAEARLTGAASGDAAGFAVANPGDPNGDGYGDALIGAPYADLDSSTAASGVAWLVYGPMSGDISLASADATRTGETSSSQAGSALAGGADVDGDGFVDLLVGAYGWESARGAAYLLAGGGM